MSQESIADSNENVEMAEEESEENQEPKLYNHVLTEEQKQRKIKCVTWDDKVVEVEWYLMMQCGAFVLLWESLNLEDAANPEALDNFNFPLNEITEECFVKVVEWLRNHQGLGPIEIKYDHITGERKWFTLTEWEKNFFEIDFEFLKEVYLASNFLDIKSLYYYCAQEAARCIMDKSAQEIRDMLGLPDVRNFCILILSKNRVLNKPLCI
uniref:Skp1-related protein n=1 Tax=Meloidogyne incognita TaxID=6306 RepID=A0A914KYP6_MELIC